MSVATPALAYLTHAGWRASFVSFVFGPVQKYFRNGSLIAGIEYDSTEFLWILTIL